MASELYPDGQITDLDTADWRPGSGNFDDCLLTSGPESRQAPQTGCKELVTNWVSIISGGSSIVICGTSENHAMSHAQPEENREYA